MHLLSVSWIPCILKVVFYLSFDKACGPNRFGRSCEHRCNTSVDEATACRGVQICLPDPYGCSCAPGYTGLNCTIGEIIIVLYKLLKKKVCKSEFGH